MGRNTNTKGRLKTMWNRLLQKVPKIRTYIKDSNGATRS